MSLGKRLKLLRIDNNLLQKDLAKILDVRNTTISAWEKDINEPDIKTLKKLAQLFDVTTDYLLGLENEAGIKINNISNSFNHNKGEINFKS